MKKLNNQPNSVEIQQNVLCFGETVDEGQARAAIIKCGQILYEHGLLVANDGNISVKMNDGNILITPAGVCKGRMSSQDLIVIDSNGQVIKPAANTTLKTTSEQPMHLEVYRQRPDVKAVIHTHLAYTNALAISKGEIRMDVIPEAAMTFGKVPITNFALPSSAENADAIRDLIKDHDVLIIRNHGSLAGGKDLDQALIHTERLEHVCKTLVYAELLGNVNVLPDDILEQIRREKI